MHSYPTLHFIVRFGRIGAVALASLVAMAVGVAGMPWLGWGAIVAAIVCAAVCYVVARSYVELVTLIADMLIPR